MVEFVRDPAKLNDLGKYLQEKNDPALQLLLCSSTRGLVVAVCRRLQHLEQLSNRAIGFWESMGLQQQAHSEQKTLSFVLYKSYQRMQRVTAAGLVKVQAFETLLTHLGSDIRVMYSATLTELLAKSMNIPVPQPGGPVPKQLESTIRVMQNQCELRLLVGAGMQSMWRRVIGTFLTTHLNEFKATGVDQDRVFFHDYSLLEVVFDSRASLAQRRLEGRYVDVFRRVEIQLGKVGAEILQQQQQQRQGQQGQRAPVWTGQWRRCTRCSAVMEDVYGQQPGFIFVLGQQKRCACGGCWGLLPKGTSVI